MKTYKATITGINGFIGNALNKKLQSMGWETGEQLRPDVDYVFLFGSPSSNDWFGSALSYSVRETIENFLNAADFCRDNKIRLIYPSSGTVYEGQTPYSKTRMILDILNGIYKDNILGLRIFAGYGVGEKHKGKYASVIYQFIQEMKSGKSPVIWGDGRQTRDFIYIDDVIDLIIKNKDLTGVVDIGTGINTSLLEVVKMINEELHTKIKPMHIPKPEQYINDTVCQKPCKIKVSLKDGIKRIINEYL